MKWLAVGVGGFLGAVLRYSVSSWGNNLIQSDFPLGTMVVNVSGAFLLGFLAGWFEAYPLTLTAKLLLTTGMLGAFTTFSTFSYETLLLLQADAYLKAMMNVGLSILLGLAAVYIGFISGKALSVTFFERI